VGVLDAAEQSLNPTVHECDSLAFPSSKLLAGRLSEVLKMIRPVWLYMHGDSRWTPVLVSLFQISGHTRSPGTDCAIVPYVLAEGTARRRGAGAGGVQVQEPKLQRGHHRSQGLCPRYGLVFDMDQRVLQFLISLRDSVCDSAFMPRRPSA
jgi:hypothetical protein